MNLTAAQINPDLLPQSLRDLVEVIGVDATLKLVQHRPGVPVYVPARPHADHPLAAVIGLEALTQLSAVYAQEHLRLPKLDAAARQVKHALVRQLRAAQMSNRDIALQVGYTQRRVEQLGQQAANELPDPTPDLFGDQS